MHRLFILSVLILTLINLSGCYGGDRDLKPLANQKSLDDLAMLIGEYPALSAASLQEIKLSAEQVGDLSFALDPVKPEVAKKAQILIDDILNYFDFQTELSAGFKVAGILINMQKESLKRFENLKGESGFSKFDPNFAPKEFSCETFMNNPFEKIPKEKYDQISQINKELMKKTISGCPGLLTQKFVQCIADWNLMISAINEYATCEIGSIDELERTLDSKTNNKFTEKSKTVQKCLSEHFSSCGFKFEKVSQN